MAFLAGCPIFYSLHVPRLEAFIEELDDPAFERGRSYLKVGRETDALDEFLSVTRRVTQAPKSHLEAGRLISYSVGAKRPSSCNLSFSEIFTSPAKSARESPMVEQLIVTAEREIIRKLAR